MEADELPYRAAYTLQLHDFLRNWYKTKVDPHPNTDRVRAIVCKTRGTPSEPYLLLRSLASLLVEGVALYLYHILVVAYKNALSRLLGVSSGIEEQNVHFDHNTCTTTPELWFPNSIRGGGAFGFWLFIMNAI